MRYVVLEATKDGGDFIQVLVPEEDWEDSPLAEEYFTMEWEGPEKVGEVEILDGRSVLTAGTFQSEWG